MDARLEPELLARHGVCDCAVGVKDDRVRPCETEIEVADRLDEPNGSAAKIGGNSSAWAQMSKITAGQIRVTVWSRLSESHCRVATGGSRCFRQATAGTLIERHPKLLAPRGVMGGVFCPAQRRKGNGVREMNAPPARRSWLHWIGQLAAVSAPALPK